MKYTVKNWKDTGVKKIFKQEAFISVSTSSKSVKICQEKWKL